MANLKGVIISKGALGVNTLTAGDEISGLVIAAPDTAGMIAGETKVVYNINDVEALGFTAAYDAANFVNAYRHLSEFYRLAEEGTKLTILLVAQATTLSGIFTETVANAADSPAQLLLVASGGDIRQIAAVVNPTAAPVALDGFTTEIYAAIPKAQAVADWAYNNSMPCQVLLEGYAYGGNAATVQGVRDIANVDAPKVSVIIGQDWKYADTLPVDDGTDPVYMRTLADVGTALGTLAAAAINQSIGDNSAFNLTDATRDAWMVAGLSNHTKNSANFNSLQTLENKGFIFGVTYPGFAGVRWNGDHTCVEVVIDAQGNINEHTISYGRVLDKAIRLLFSAYLPELKKAWPVIPATGLLPTGVIKHFEGVGQSVLNDMLLRNEISLGTVTVDEASDLITEKVLKIKKIKIVPYGYSNAIEASINLKSRL